jgi:hypothetical protein
MFQPGITTEAAAYGAFLREQVEAMRNAAHGLTDDEARQAPAASDLSIGGILKHLSYSWTSWERREAQTRGDRGWELTPDDYAQFFGSFALADGETLAEIVARYDDHTGRLLAAVEAVDPDAVLLDPPAPWFGRTEPVETSARNLVLHQIEEFARHAGHADIVREQLDGAKAGELTLAVHGIEGNDFLQPWRRREPADH